MKVDKPYDYCFIGLGASNSLIIRSLYSAGLLHNQRISVIDPDSKTQNDKTFCFWATAEEVENLDLYPLINYSWDKVNFSPESIQKIDPLKYYHISSINLYNSVRKILNELDTDYFQESAANILYEKEQDLLLIKTEKKQIATSMVFDSRPPIFKKAKANQILLYQSFLGWKIKTDKEVFDKNVFTMMDFEVDQSDSTQFVYILPFEKNIALVELTRFGSEPIDHNYAREQLEMYCKEKNWQYVIEQEEKGKIPMSSCPVTEFFENEKYIRTGSGAGKIKPSTGYAFKEMAADAVRVANHLKTNYSFKGLNIRNLRTGRFAFYDRLLLKILEKNPEKGKEIFSLLFKKVNGLLVLKFLDQKTTFQEDMSVILSLQKGLFIKKAVLDIYENAKKLSFSLLPLMIAFLCLLFNLMGLESISISILSIGLMLFGIPHGAMDHILINRSSSQMIVFIMTYLLKGLAIFLLWKVSTLLGLLLFLLYSFWHFGQADFEQWRLPVGLHSFFWGTSLLSFLLFSHSDETKQILTQIFKENGDVSSLFLLSKYGLYVSVILLAFYLVWIRKIEHFFSVLSLLVASFLPLIQAFGVYFIFQHSINGWTHIKNRFEKTNRELWHHSAPFTVGAIVIFILFFTNTKEYWTEQIGPFFIFLSCVSFPHVIKMHLFYSRK